MILLSFEIGFITIKNVVLLHKKETQWIHVESKKKK